MAQTGPPANLKDGPGFPYTKSGSALLHHAAGLVGVGEGMIWGAHAGVQVTLRDEATVSGIGVHSGAPVSVTLHPAEADTGIVFLRCGSDGLADRELKAHYHSV